MLRSSTVRTVLAVVAVLVALSVLRFKPWQQTPDAGSIRNPQSAIRNRLTVGFLPVT
jgi:hypothetical protein